MCVIDGRRYRIGEMPLGANPLGKAHGGRSALSGLAGLRGGSGSRSARP